MIGRRAVLATLLTIVAPPLAAAQASPESELLDLINRHRQSAGLGTLTGDPRLQRAAAAHAADLARRNRVDHTNGAGEDLSRRLARAGYAWRTAAENVAQGGAAAADVLALWLASDGHRRNLLLAEISEAGIGRAGDPSWPFWVLIVTRPAGSRDLAPTG